MKTAETKSASQQHKMAAQSFFNQGQEQTFFSAQTSDRSSFFPSTASNPIQFKSLSESIPFFSPSPAATIQAKCATCEAEEKSQTEAPQTTELLSVQKMPAFESERAIQAKALPKAEAIASPSTPSPKPQQISEDKEIESQEEGIAETPQIQMMPAFSSAGDSGDGDDANADQPEIQFSLKIGQPNDAYEQEAEAMANRVVSTPKAIAFDGSPNLAPKQLGVAQPQQVNRKQTVAMRSLMRQQADGSPTIAPKNIESRLQAQGSGAPLDTNTRSEMEGAFDADFSGVQVHTGQEAATLNQSLGARAFTHGNKIFFNSGEYQPQSQSGKHLLAHELTHTLQQGASVQRSQKDISNTHETMVQGSWWDDLTDFGEELGWKIVREFAPGLEPILRKGPEGIFEWLKDMIGSAIEGVFNKLMTPIRAIAGIDSQLIAHFAPLLASIQVAASKIASNDCTPISEAAEKIEQAAVRLITPIIEKLQPVVAKIKDFMNGLWDKIGAPIWGWIQQYAANQWAQIQWLGEKLQAVGKWIWDKTATIRSFANKMWTWFKNKLGIGEGAEGSNGLLQWVQRKIDAAWAIIKAKLEPFKQQIISIGLTVGGVALALSPAGPVLAVGAAVAGAVKGLRWIYANWGKGNMIVQARAYLEKSLIPMLLSAANRLGASVTRMAETLSGALGNLAAGMTNAVSAIGGSLLRGAMAAVQWIADKVTALGNWAKQTLIDLTHRLEETLNNLQGFLHKMLNFFAEVGKVVLDIWLLPAFLAKTVWNWIPQCIRDPIVDFIGPIILRQIEIFQELAKDKEAWLKTKADVMKIINLVFTNHDLMGAVKATFHLILRVFNIPPELLITIAQKALSAWDHVSKKPLEFIKNTVRALGKGFQLLWKNIGEHLKFGLQGWLFGELAEKNISPPTSWTDPKAIFGFVLDVLGISVNHIWELLAKRFPPEQVAKVRLRFGQVTRAIEWINKAIDTSKSPTENARGIVDQAKDFGASILTGIAEWVAGKVAEELAILAAAAAASGGLSEVLDIVRRIYKAIKTAVRWARRILDMVNETFDNIIDIATGNLEPVGAKFEQIMHRGMPVVIGFLADQVGLGGVGQALRDIVDTLREEVDKAILWLIDKIKAGIEALIGALKAGVAALMDWWKASTTFTAADGEEHKLFFKGEEDNAVLTVKSDEQTFTDFVDRANTGTDADKITAKQEAQRIAGLIDAERTKPLAGSTPEEKDAAKSQKAIRINELLVELQPHTSKLFGTTIPDSFSGDPNASVKSAGGFGTSMSIKPLTNKNRPAGSPPTSANHAKYVDLNERRDSPGGASYYIKGHLLNQKLGGSGKWENLTPLSRSGNAQHEVQVESIVKRSVDLPAIVEYSVEPNYDSGSRSGKESLLTRISNSLESLDVKRVKAAIVEAEDFVPTSLTTKAYILDESLQQKKTILNQTVSNPIDRNYESYHLSSSPPPIPVNLSTDDDIKIATIPGIGGALAVRIYEVQRERRKTFERPFTSYNQLGQEVPEIGAEQMKKLQEASYVKLY
jgi:DNA uptake protein ComE-like DNA-binding protein